MKFVATMAISMLVTFGVSHAPMSALKFVHIESCAMECLLEAYESKCTSETPEVNKSIPSDISHLKYQTSMEAKSVKIMDGDCWQIVRSRTKTTTASTFAHCADHRKLRSSNAASLRGRDVSTMCSRK